MREVPRQIGDCEVRGLPMVNPRTDVAGQKTREAIAWEQETRGARDQSHLRWLSVLPVGDQSHREVSSEESHLVETVSLVSLRAHPGGPA